MSFQRLLLLVVALGREESDTSFGCTKTHGDNDRPRVSLLLVLPLTHPALPWRGSVFVDLLCLNISPEKKRACFSSELIHFPAVHTQDGSAQCRRRGQGWREEPGCSG